MNLSELFATWQAWHTRDVAEQAARRAEIDGRDDDADQLRRDPAGDGFAPRAIEALAAQHELAERLGDWRWHTVTAAREQGASWNDVAAATGTDPTTAQQAYRDRVTAAEQTAAGLDIPFHDAERYRAAAANDPLPPTRADTGQEIDDMTTHGNDDRIEHISGPDIHEDGLVVGEIALPGGLPPDDEEDEEEEDDAGLDIPRWDEAWSIADRDGYVLFDPETPGGFRALTPHERTELTDTVRAGSPSFTADATEPADRAAADLNAGRVDPRVSADQTPWVDSPEGVAERERWAIENADPTKALDNSDPDDRDALERRLDDLRVRLTGYTWREGVDRDQALADRREQLGRWYDDDHAAEADAGEQSGDSVERDPECSGTGPVPDPRWYW
ncbi:hypothetical protein LQ327_30380 [Actinomycetospora endophytica]|uniref:Uncharacterized protein n=1 Tax=Actinomycetospora endophytica TaxID=2291215 RepID=A0ABS8PHD5_9PSEU|nr:hypothetical protein [Actinomycetospora endophytica]MCD2197687.1 hypothetical protein [Actinomycetospora endophytica]